MFSFFGWKWFGLNCSAASLSHVYVSEVVLSDGSKIITTHTFDDLGRVVREAREIIPSPGLTLMNVHCY
jgi:hypothetical protein